MSEDKTSVTISEKTLIPVSFLVIILIAVVQIVSTSFKANANEKDIEKLKDERDVISQELKEHGLALARIETALGIEKPSKNP